MTSDILRDELEPVAGNGLLHRRLFLTHGAAAGAALLTARAASAAPLDVPASMKTPGVPPSAYGDRSPHEARCRESRRAPRRRSAPAARARRSRASRA